MHADRKSRKQTAAEPLRVDHVAQVEQSAGSIVVMLDEENARASVAVDEGPYGFHARTTADADECRRLGEWFLDAAKRLRAAPSG